MDRDTRIPKPRGKRAELLRWLERERPAQIDEPEWAILLAELNPVSAGYLRRLLRESGIPLGPLVGGVRQDTYDALESSLLKLLDEYEHGDAARRTSVRRLVIDAKDHARWSARKPERRAEKEEMTLWMLTWLENPPLFRHWIRLRRQTLQGVL
jgi:hypothetical protein